MKYLKTKCINYIKDLEGLCTNMMTGKGFKMVNSKIRNIKGSKFGHNCGQFD